MGWSATSTGWSRRFRIWAWMTSGAPSGTILLTAVGSRFTCQVVGVYAALRLTVAGRSVKATTWKPPLIGGWAKKFGARSVYAPDAPGCRRSGPRSRSQKAVMFPPLSTVNVGARTWLEVFVTDT